MPSKQTSNYKLNQWSKSDQVLMEDFNADNAKTDAAIKAEADARTAADAALSAAKADVSALNALTRVVAGKGSFITGTYVGDQTASRFISLGVTPKALLLFTSFGSTHGINNAHGGLILPGHPVKDSSATVCEIVDNGFQVYYTKDKSSGNHTYTYHYIAFI